MSDNLVAELRGAADGTLRPVHAYSLCGRAADALEAKDREIASQEDRHDAELAEAALREMRLTAELAYAKANANTATNNVLAENVVLKAERDRLQQELASLASENACRMISERRLRAALVEHAECCTMSQHAREALAAVKP